MQAFFLGAICLLSGLLLCRPTGSFAQTDEKDLEVIKAAMQFVHYREPIIYVKQINVSPSLPEPLKAKIMQGHFYRYPENSRLADLITGEVKIIAGPTDSLVLTAAEKALLIAQIPTESLWPENLFPNSICCSRDSMWSALGQTRRKVEKQRASNDSDQSPAYSYVFSFTRPIYLRNSSICFVAINAMCGGECGRSLLAFFKQTGGQWAEWMFVSGGDF